MKGSLMSDEIKVKVTCYKEFLIIEAVKPDKDKNFIPTGGSKIGCVLIDTEKYLGMSDEAYELLKTIKPSNDAIGDVMTWEANEMGHCFGWLGPIKRLVNPKTSECSRDGIIDLKYVKIPNDVPPDAAEAVTKFLG
jgi:hypothetical protein